MSDRSVDRIAAALLYEGYMLYPYRPSAIKNRQRFNFGIVYPGGTDANFMQTDCLVLGTASTSLTVAVRFLHLIDRTIDGHSWQEAVERTVTVDRCTLGAVGAAPRYTAFAWPATTDTDGAVVRRQRAIGGEIEVAATACASGAIRVRAGLVNLTEMPASARPNRDAQLLHSLVSAHTILTVSGGEFVSLLDPPDAFRQDAADCVNVRTWPVLVGEPGQRDTMLSSPIIIYDYPALAPESPGDLFDGTEIDEILSLRILTMTDDEQREMAQSDARARLLLERTRALDAEDFMKMHGTMRPV